MRLAVCTLSAVLLSGCSWLGYGGNNASYGGGYGAAGCDNAQLAYGGGACDAGAGYGLAGYGAGNGYGANGYGQGVYGQGVYGQGVYGQGAYGQGAYGANGYGMSTNGANGPSVSGYGPAGAGMVGYGAGVGGYGAGTGTVLDGAAPYGAAVGGAGTVSQYASGQMINGQWVPSNAGYGGAYGTNGNVTTVQGAPIYVQQPYPSYYPVGVAVGGLRGGSSAMPFGVEFGIGTDIAIGGDIVGAKPAGPALTCCGNAGNLNVSATDAISYGDAYKNAVSYDMAATYDIDPSMTLIGRVGYSTAEGQRLKIGTLDDSQTNPAPNTTTEDLYAQWSDLEQVTLEGGFRKYMGGWNNSMSGIRPYVGAMAGFTHNNAVNIAQESATLMPVGTNVQQYIDAGWTPTASGVLGAEMQVGPRTALGIETGIRWSDSLNTNFESDDRWSVPVKLRGRVSF